MEVQFLPSGDMGITVEFGKEISLEINTKVRMLHHDLKEHLGGRSPAELNK